MSGGTDNCIEGASNTREYLGQKLSLQEYAASFQLTASRKSLELAEASLNVLDRIDSGLLTMTNVLHTVEHNDSAIRTAFHDSFTEKLASFVSISNILSDSQEMQNRVFGFSAICMPTLLHVNELNLLLEGAETPSVDAIAPVELSLDTLRSIISSSVLSVHTPQILEHVYATGGSAQTRTDVFTSFISILRDVFPRLQKQMDNPRSQRIAVLIRQVLSPKAGALLDSEMDTRLVKIFTVSLHLLDPVQYRLLYSSATTSISSALMNITKDPFYLTDFIRAFHDWLIAASEQLYQQGMLEEINTVIEQSSEGLLYRFREIMSARHYCAPSTIRYAFGLSSSRALFADVQQILDSLSQISHVNLFLENHLLKAIVRNEAYVSACQTIQSILQDDIARIFRYVSGFDDVDAWCASYIDDQCSQTRNDIEEYSRFIVLEKLIDAMVSSLRIELDRVLRDLPVQYKLSTLFATVITDNYSAGNDIVNKALNAIISSLLVLMKQQTGATESIRNMALLWQFKKVFVAEPITSDIDRAVAEIVTTLITFTVEKKFAMYAKLPNTEHYGVPSILLDPRCKAFRELWEPSMKEDVKARLGHVFNIVVDEVWEDVMRL